MTRGVDATKINVVPAGLSTVKKLNKDTIIYILSGQTIDTADDLFGPTNTDPLRSIIIVGGNLRIDNDIEKHPQVNTSRAVIVMKNDAGQGGNIYIKDNVKNIYTTLIAE